MTKPFEPQPELRLLLAAARAVVSPGSMGQIRLASPTDWTILTRLALHHGITPLLADALESVCTEPIPPEIREALGLHFEANGEAVAREIEELARLLPALDGQDVPALAIGGSVLAERAYGRAELRREGSLDLLIRREQENAVQEILQRDGFVRVAAHPSSDAYPGVRFRAALLRRALLPTPRRLPPRAGRHAARWWTSLRCARGRGFSTAITTAHR